VAPRVNTPYFEGACLCGKLSFRIAPPTKWCAHCHCSMCQRAHGAALVTWVGIEESRFELLHANTLTWYASSAGAQRGFCSRCGTSLLFRSSRWPGEMHVVRASIAAEIDRLPEAHVFTSTRASWFPFEDHLARKS